jgi:16S rRNA (guanine(527)-N(7))-methyltransferase RsmG
MIDYELLTNEAKAIGIDLGDYGADRFDTYAERLVRWNKHVNLTSITDPDDIVIKHFIDSLIVTKYVDFKEGEKLVDVGTGAGFPGLPLLIANPKLELTFVDALGKRLAFIKDVMSNMGLVATRTHGRAEDVGRKEEFREQFDYATARAVAPLNILCEYCMPLVKVGGLFIAMKGAAGRAEADMAENAIATLGGEIAKLEEYELPGGDKRSLIIIRKISQTPTKYPRKPKKIDNHPL